MITPLAVLIVEDSESDALLVVRLLNKAGYEVAYQQVETAEQMRAALEKQAWDIVISDYSLPHFDGPAALALLHEKELDIPFIVVSGTIGEETAVLMLKSGAHDYLVKGNLARLVPAVERELAQAKERRERREAEEELRRSRELLNQSFGSLYDALFIIDAATSEILDCNPAACEMFGYERSEIVGQTTALLHVDKTTLTEYRRRLSQSVQEKGFFYVPEYKMRRKDGTLFLTDQTVTPLRDSGGRITGWVSALRDITERKQAEEALRESESILRGFLEQSEDAIMLADEQGKVIQWSRGAEKLTGYSRAESIGKALWDIQFRSAPNEFKTTERHELIKTSLQAALVAGQGTILNRLTEAAIERPDGIRLITQSLAFSIRTNKGFMLGSILRDITERKQAEEAIQHTAALLSEALNIASLANWEYDVEKDLFLFNDHFYSILHTTAEREGGYSMSAGQYAKRFVHPEDAPGIAAAIKSALASTDRHYNNQREHRILYRDGGVGHILAIVHIDRDEQGRIIRYYGVNQDITERKLAEEATKHTAALLSEAMDIARLANWEYDIEKDLFLFNDHFYAIFHTTAEQQGGYRMSSAQYAQRLVHPDDAAVVGSAIEKALASTERNYRTQLEHRILYADGGIGYISVSIHIDRDEQGRIIRYYGVNQDITERKLAEEATKHTAALLSEAMDIARLANWEYDIEKDLFLFNDHFYAIFHTTAEQQGGYRMSSALYAQRLVHPDDLPVVGAEIEKALASTERNYRTQLEHRILYADGGIGYISVSIHIDRDEQGRILRYYGVNQDITERRRAAEMSTYLASIVEASDDAIIGKTLDGIITSWNSGARQLYGYSDEEVIGQPVSLLVPPDRPNELPEILSRIRRGESVEHYETIRVRKDGARLNVSLTLSPIKDASGQVVGASSIGRDITSRQQAEQALQASEARYRGLFEDSPISLWEEDFSAVKQRLDMLSEEGITDFKEYFSSHPEVVVELAASIKVVDINQVTLKMFGAHRKEELAKNLADLSIIGQSQEFLVEFVNMAEGKTSFGWDGINKTLDGRLINIGLWWSAAPGYEKSLSRVIISMIDITERKRAEAALAKSERDYRALFENMPIGLYRTAMDGRMLDANQAMVKIFGYQDREALLPMNVKDLYLNPDSYREFKSEMEKSDILSNFEAEFKRPDGSVFWAEDHIRLIRDEAGKPLFYEGSIIDITERRRAEEALRKSEQVLRQAESLGHTGSWEQNLVTGKIFNTPENLRLFFGNDPSKGEPFEDYAQAVHPDDREFVLQNHALLLEGGPGDIEFRVVWPDDSVHVLFGRASVVRDESGQAIRVYGTNVDITERKRAEEALHESQQRYRALFEDSPVAIWEQDFSGLKKHLDSLKQQGQTDLPRYFKTHPEALSECAALIRYLDVNKAALKLYRADSKEDLFKNTEQALTRAQQEHILDDFIAITQGKTANSWEGADETFTGEPIEISLNWSVVPGYENDFSKVIVTTVDITERRRAEKRIKQQLERLAALRTIDQVITASFDLRNSLTIILRQVTKELGVDAADVLLLNDANLFLEYSAGVGFRTRAAEKASVRMGQSYAGRVALDRQIIQVPNLKDQPEDLPLKTQLTGEDFAAYVGVPLVAKGIVKGVLEVYHRTPLQPDQEWLDFLNTLAGQAALAIDNSQLFENLQRSNIDLTLAYDATIEGWSQAMDLRDKETEGHTLRVTEMTMELAGLFGIKDEDLVSIRRGALLHDIGKMGIPDSILLKPDTLTDDEWVIMRKHPMLAFELLSAIRYLRSAIDIPYCHHEKWDGTGYPRGLKGEQIPLPARIFAVVDVWDALTSDRPYRKAWSREKTIEYIKSQAGKHFDPQVLAVCLESGVFDGKKPN